MSKGKSAAGAIRIGIGGWTYADWRGNFYPEALSQKRELEYASSQLTSIEINGTYYGAQKPETFAKWRDETPENFVFAVKAPRFVMNRNVLAEAGNTITRFLNGGVLQLKQKLGPINWQFLPTKQFEPTDFAAFLNLLPQKVAGQALRHAVEVRHASFRSAQFVELARKHQVAVVIAGDSAYPQIADATAEFAYLRIMGTQSGQALGYSNKALDAWAQRAQAIATGETAKGLDQVQPSAAAKPRDVYLYVISGHKASNPAAAMSLIKRIS